MSRKFIPLTHLALASLAIIALCGYFYVALARMTYPFSLEWIEANTFLHVLRVLQNKPLYAPPSYDFISLLYTPFYYYIAAIFTPFTSDIMVSMRLVSIIASLIIFVMIYALCRLRQTTPLISIGSAGLFAASYAVTGYWFDVGKMDSLFLAFLLIAYLLMLLRTKRDNLVGALAGIALFLSFATKQQAFVVLPFLLLHLIVERRWMKALWLGMSFMVSGVIFIICMNSVTEGWFWFYVYEVPSAHPVSWEIMTHSFWTLYMIPQYPWVFMVILIATFILLVQRNRKHIFNYVLFVFTFLLPLSAISIVSMAHQWGWINNLLPIVAGISVISAEAYQKITDVVNDEHKKTRLYMGLYSLVSVSMLFQFTMLRYDIRSQIPSRITLTAGYEILDVIRASKDPIFIPTSPYLLYMADQPTHFQASSMGDLSLAIQRSSVIREKAKIYQDNIYQYMLSKTIQTTILPNANWYDHVFSTENEYTCESLVSNNSPLITVTGAISYLDRVCRFQAKAIK